MQDIASNVLITQDPTAVAPGKKRKVTGDFTSDNGIAPARDVDEPPPSTGKPQSTTKPTPVDGEFIKLLYEELSKLYCTSQNPIIFPTLVTKRSILSV